MKTIQRPRYSLLLVSFLAVALLTALGLHRLQIDTNIVNALPQSDKSITDALAIFNNHPIQDQIAIDIAANQEAPDLLVAYARALEKKLKASGLFNEIGMEKLGTLLPDLAQGVVQRLPQLLTAAELQHQVAPRLAPAAINKRLQQELVKLQGLEGVGQASFLSADPLGIRELILAKMRTLAPTGTTRIYKQHLLSGDGRHLLVTAHPRLAGTDSAQARQITALFQEIEKDLKPLSTNQDTHLTITSVGAYRAALDNEEIIRHDVRLALLLSTVGIALLLYFAFPRPLLGLLSLLPALAGSSAALFVYSLFHDAISIMVLGFGGALISITVDHGIAYFLHLDRTGETRGEKAAKAVRAVGGGTALLTTMGAFLMLSLSDFPVFTQLGQFTALGFIFTYLFIHLVFPKIFPVMPPARIHKQLLLHRLLKWVHRRGKTGAVAALLFMLCLLPFAKPEFHISLSDMNTVRQETLQADHQFSQTWGDLGKKIYLMTTSPDLARLQRQNDRLLTQLEEDQRNGAIHPTFVPSMLFPGPERSRANQQAWSQFWTTARQQRLHTALMQEGKKLGFTAEAFAPFFHLLPQTSQSWVPLPGRFAELFGISSQPEGAVIQFTSIIPGKQYQASAFQEQYGTTHKIFDAQAFTHKLGRLLFHTFTTMLVIIAAMIALLLFFQLLDWRLTLLTLSPPLFAYICTLGTLHYLGHPLDIPGLMLSIVILGMGIDYAIYMVCGAQWYGDVDHPDHLLVRSTIFMAGASTLIGFGVLCFAEHSLLRSVGIVSGLGIAYSLLGTFFLLPPLLRWYFRRTPPGLAEDAPIKQKILARYRQLEAYPRMFARFKLRLDPLFAELPPLLALHPHITRILDIGCGYALPACWCLETLPRAEMIGLDPDPERIRVASRAMGERGQAVVGAAPAIKVVEQPVDGVMLLDMIHYLDDEHLQQTLANATGLLTPGGLLILRYVISPAGKKSLGWYYEDWRLKLAGARAWYRSHKELTNLLQLQGLAVIHTAASANSDLFWLVGKKPGAPS